MTHFNLKFFTLIALINPSANIIASTSDSKSPLYIAIIQRSQSTVRSLLAQKADPYQQSCGIAPLDLAYSLKDFEIGNTIKAAQKIWAHEHSCALAEEISDNQIEMPIYRDGGRLQDEISILYALSSSNQRKAS